MDVVDGSNTAGRHRPGQEPQRQKEASVIILSSTNISIDKVILRFEIISRKTIAADFLLRLVVVVVAVVMAAAKANT